MTEYEHRKSHDDDYGCGCAVALLIVLFIVINAYFHWHAIGDLLRYLLQNG